jgi:hypothetical protein
METVAETLNLTLVGFSIPTLRLHHTRALACGSSARARGCFVSVAYDVD